ncbi:MAG TPA: hypothetical protein VI457_09450 [Methylococcaceae bacterium]|nr:hypothetical protein [Methylococcaceae bacterium]
MLTLAEQLRPLAHGYVRHGGKRNRRQQMKRLAAFLTWIQSRERVTGLDQVGKRHVILFWKAQREMAPRTLYGYWLAIRELWRWLERPGEPPRPLQTNAQSQSHEFEAQS